MICINILTCCFDDAVEMALVHAAVNWMSLVNGVASLTQVSAVYSLFSSNIYSLYISQSILTVVFQVDLG